MRFLEILRELSELVSSNAWETTLTIYCVLALTTLLPVLRVWTQPVKLLPSGPSFDASPLLTEKAKTRLIGHYQRLQGTLGFWKTRAERYRALHFYCVAWSIPPAVLVPFLIQAMNNGSMGKWCVTVMAAHAALMLGFHRALKVEHNYQAFRHGESEFYDLYRRLLDRPHAFGETEDEQLDSYFEQVEKLRQFVRHAETDNFASLADLAVSPPSATAAKKD